MNRKFAIVLSGSGVYDGTEIHEATLTMLAISKAGSTYQCFAPNIPQHHVINHLTGEEMPETRNVLIESARIARGDVKELNDFKASEYDILIFPGGFGVAKNLSSLAFDGPNLSVNKEVQRVILSMVEAKKPIGALCIAPALIAKVIKGAKVTIGSDVGTIQAIEALGGEHVVAGHAELVVDEEHKLVTTPCYMLDANILQIAEGAENVVKKLLTLYDF